MNTNWTWIRWWTTGAMVAMLAFLALAAVGKARNRDQATTNTVTAALGGAHPEHGLWNTPVNREKEETFAASEVSATAEEVARMTKTTARAYALKLWNGAPPATAIANGGTNVAVTRKQMWPDPGPKRVAFITRNGRVRLG